MSTTLPEPMSDAALRQQAQAQVDAEIKSQADPIQGQIASAQRNQASAIQQIGSTFTDLQPTVDQGAQNVKSSYDQALGVESNIFDTANQRLNQLMQGRAAEAQRMAQELGAPVAVSDFTRPFDNAQMDLTQLGAGQQLHTLAYAQAGEQQAQAFASQVFPVMRTEQEAQVRRQYAEEIKQLEDQLTAVRQQKGAQVNARFSQLREAELTYRLNVAQARQAKLDSQRSYNLQVKTAKQQHVDATHQYNLDRQQLHIDAADKLRTYKLALKEYNLNDKKANRDWKLALKTYGLEKDKVDLMQDEFNLHEGELTGVYNGMPTEAAKEAQLRDQREAAAQGITVMELQQQKELAMQQATLAEKKFNADQRIQAIALMEQALAPKPGSTIKQTAKVEVPKPTSIQNVPKDWFMERDPKTGKERWYHLVTTTSTSQVSTPITDPNKMIDYLTAAGNMSKPDATKLVKARFAGLGLPSSWKYGQTWPKKKTTKTGAGNTSVTVATPNQTYDQYKKQAQAAAKASGQPVLLMTPKQWAAHQKGHTTAVNIP